MCFIWTALVVIVLFVLWCTRLFDCVTLALFSESHMEFLTLNCLSVLVCKMWHIWCNQVTWTIRIYNECCQNNFILLCLGHVCWCLGALCSLYIYARYVYLTIYARVTYWVQSSLYMCNLLHGLFKLCYHPNLLLRLLLGKKSKCSNVLKCRTWRLGLAKCIRAHITDVQMNARSKSSKQRWLRNLLKASRQILASDAGVEPGYYARWSYVLTTTLLPPAIFIFNSHMPVS